MIVVREATLDDADTLLAWANDPATRAGSRRHAAIGAAEHRRWLEAHVASPDGRIWIGQAGEVAVGTIRVERIAPGALEVSITVAPAERGRGRARPLLEAGLMAARAAFPGHRFVAEILPDNAASIALFTRAGFEPVSATESPGGVPGIRHFERD